MPRKYKPLAERFWSKVDRRTEDECWPWTAAIGGEGYGRITVVDRSPKQQPAHRIAYELTYGPIPDGLLVRHFVCANTICVNPNHLRLGGKSENAKDAVRDTGWMKGDKHPSRTHPDRVPRGSKLPQSKLTESQVTEMRALWASGNHTVDGLVKQFGVSRAIVTGVIHGHTYMHVGSVVQPTVRPVTTVGSRHGHHKLTEPDIPVIRARIAAGESFNAVGRAFGVAAATISDVARGRTWIHIP